MRSEIINSFLQGINNVFGTLFSVNLQVGKIYIKKMEYTTDENVLIYVGVTGAYRGQAVISMKYDTAFEIAKRMTGGFSSTSEKELDELQKSALSELGNMVMGKSSSYLEKCGIVCDITPPTLMVGQNFRLNSPSEAQNICVPLSLDGYPFEFTVFLKEKIQPSA